VITDTLAAEYVEALMAHEREEVDRKALHILRGSA
jgi:hypothetical protein